MKAASKIFRIFVVGVTIVSSLLVFLPKAYAENEQGTYEIIYWVDQELVSADYDETFDRILYAYNVRIHAYCNDPTVIQYVSLTYTNGLGLTGTAGINVINGYATRIVESYTSNTKLSMGIIVNRTSVNSGNVLTEVVSLSDDTINAIVSSFSSIDTQIDTITWQTADNAVIKGYSTTVDGTYSFDPISTNQTDIYMKIHLPLYYDNRLWKIKTDITFNGRTSAQIFDTNLISFPHIYYLNNNTGALTERQPRIYPFSNGSYLTLYIDSNMAMSNTNDIIIQVHREYTGLRVLNLEDYPSYIKYIDDNDIEFWELLNIIQNASDYYANFDNQQQEENLQDSVDDYVQTEDNLINGFDTAITNNAVDPLQLPNSNPGNWGTGFTGSLGLIGHVFNQLTASATGGNAVYLLMNFSLMLGLALLIIGKRG